MTGEPQPQPGRTTEEPLKWPVGFIVMVSLAALYLIVRFAQLGGRLIDWLF
jgi:hypothetical protein